jgi:hypothetical protein
MILSIWRPKTKSINKKQVVIYYTLCDIKEMYDNGSSNLKVIYKCDGTSCKTPNKLYSINRHHLNEKRSKSVNDKVQTCRVCQTTGGNNPRFGDNRSWEEILGKEVSDKNKEVYRKKFIENNPSKQDIVKIKKGQIIINYEYVSNYLNQYNFKLNSIEGDNKFAKLNITCDNNHIFDIKYTNFGKNKCLCRYCYYDSIRIPFEEIERFETYSKTVRSLTRFSFNKNKNLIDPYGLKELDSKKYHIDHIYSISDGYRNDVDPKIIASYHNLRVVKKLENLQKGRKSGMELSELLEKINNQDYHKN